MKLDLHTVSPDLSSERPWVPLVISMISVLAPLYFPCITLSPSHCLTLTLPLSDSETFYHICHCHVCTTFMVTALLFPFSWSSSPTCNPTRFSPALHSPLNPTLTNQNTSSPYSLSLSKLLGDLAVSPSSYESWGYYSLTHLTVSLSLLQRTHWGFWWHR